MFGIKKVALGAALACMAQISVAADLPVIRLGALSYGTVNWELDTIKHNGLDEANGFMLEVVPMGGGNASDIAFLGGEIDAMVSDVVWAARQRAEGRDLKFIPYSTAVGGIMVKPESGITDLAGLEGKKIGIAGGPLDKSWLILQAYAEKTSGIELEGISKQEFGAPPLMFKSALTGEVDAVINFWHFQAKAKAAGLVELVSVQDAAEALGLSATTPLLGYIVSGDMDPDLANALYTASRAAKDILREEDAAWEVVRPRMKPKSDAQFDALKAGFIAGIPQSAEIDSDAVEEMLSLMGQLGGEELVGKATSVPAGLFVGS
ncbi:ABC transporter substrate-binding protein [Aliiroseovarius sp. KMU-50]|uniref:ABC transporter substrate-binding protein n=1 Tax=Aliiroseovarius salicola TaxID=3009082 RepID=A0ABT4W2L9_9RHOB|nr:ABC transporter substrate-binding protein [Aliiroseovarius sp. KMU-50]MDA5094669.1 ABC transporter substrate-binding protein [Aliiroseovarius sp. KMU-50]